MRNILWLFISLLATSSLVTYGNTSLFHTYSRAPVNSNSPPTYESALALQVADRELKLAGFLWGSAATPAPFFLLPHRIRTQSAWIITPALGLMLGYSAWRWINIRQNLAIAESVQKLGEEELWKTPQLADLSTSSTFSQEEHEAPKKPVPAPPTDPTNLLPSAREQEKSSASAAQRSQAIGAILESAARSLHALSVQLPAISYAISSTISNAVQVPIKNEEDEYHFPSIAEGNALLLWRYDVNDLDPEISLEPYRKDSEGAVYARLIKDIHHYKQVVLPHLKKRIKQFYIQKHSNNNSVSATGVPTSEGSLILSRLERLEGHLTQAISYLFQVESILKDYTQHHNEEPVLGAPLSTTIFKEDQLRLSSILSSAASSLAEVPELLHNPHWTDSDPMMPSFMPGTFDEKLLALGWAQSSQIFSSYQFSAEDSAALQELILKDPRFTPLLPFTTIEKSLSLIARHAGINSLPSFAHHLQMMWEEMSYIKRKQLIEKSAADKNPIARTPQQNTIKKAASSLLALSLHLEQEYTGIHLKRQLTENNSEEEEEEDKPVRLIEIHPTGAEEGFTHFTESPLTGYDLIFWQRLHSSPFKDSSLFARFEEKYAAFMKQGASKSFTDDSVKFQALSFITESFKPLTAEHDRWRADLDRYVPSWLHIQPSPTLFPSQPQGTWVELPREPLMFLDKDQQQWRWGGEQKEFVLLIERWHALWFLLEEFSSFLQQQLPENPNHSPLAHGVDALILYPYLLRMQRVASALEEALE